MANDSDVPTPPPPRKGMLHRIGIRGRSKSEESSFSLELASGSGDEGRSTPRLLAEEDLFLSQMEGGLFNKTSNNMQAPPNSGVQKDRTSQETDTDTILWSAS